MCWGDGFTEFEQYCCIWFCHAKHTATHQVVESNTVYSLTNGAAQACDEKDDLIFGIKYWWIIFHLKFDSPSGEFNGAQRFLSIVWKFWLLQLRMRMVVYIKQKILFVNWFILF